LNTAPVENNRFSIGTQVCSLGTFTLEGMQKVQHYCSIAIQQGYPVDSDGFNRIVNPYLQELELVLQLTYKLITNFENLTS
jgi:hypothetical protein